MGGKVNILEEQRLQQLCDVCQCQMLSQMLGSPAVTMATSENKSSGTVTTLEMRQALALMLAELANGVFEEFKALISNSGGFGKILLEEIHQRLSSDIDSIAKKAPAVVEPIFHGDISGFMSDLQVFLLSTTITAAKQLIIALRKDSISLNQASKIILFPSLHLTSDQTMQEQQKMLSTVVVTSVGSQLKQTIATFTETVPSLTPFADQISSAQTVVVTGILSVFLAYQMHGQLDRNRHSVSEEFTDTLLADANYRDEFTRDLVALCQSSLGNIERYLQSAMLLSAPIVFSPRKAV